VENATRFSHTPDCLEHCRPFNQATPTTWPAYHAVSEFDVYDILSILPSPFTDAIIGYPVEI